MKAINFSNNDSNKFKNILGYVHDWCSRNQWAVGLGEIAIGSQILAMGIKTGGIHLGNDLVGIEWEDVGGASGLALGAIAGKILGGIGIAAGGGAIGIPAVMVALGGAAVFGFAGFEVGDAIKSFLNPPVSPSEFFAGTSMVAIGTALIVDGARRLLADEKVQLLGSYLKDGVLYLADITAKVIATSVSALQDLFSPPKDTPDAIGTAATGVAGATAGAVIGGSIAATSVTVLGSHAIGGAALALGLVSAPVWPVIACGAAGLGIGYGAWRVVRKVSGH